MTEPDQFPVLSFIVPGEAVPKGRPRFFLRAGRVRVITPERTIAYEKRVAAAARAAAKALGGWTVGQRVPLAVDVVSDLSLCYGCGDWSRRLFAEPGGDILALARFRLADKRLAHVHSRALTEGQACHALLTALMHFRYGVQVVCPDHRLVAASVEVTRYLTDRIEALLSAAEEKTNDRPA
jgi:hypothetical protein